MSATIERKRLTRTQEDYLEAILLLIRRDRVARVRDIAKALGVGMPSVTSALKTLSKRGLVNYDPYQVITLSDAGRDLAEDISRRHTVIRRFLAEVLGLEAEAAEANACRMEHAVDRQLLERMRDFADFIATCPRAGESWLEAFARYGPADPERGRCRECLAAVIERFDREGKEQ